jgi:hypothetical protein
VAASAAFTDKSGTVDFDAKAAEAAALVDFPDELEADFGAKPEAAALVDFPDELEADPGAKPEPEALGASRLGWAADCLATFRCASVNGITQTARSRST